MGKKKPFIDKKNASVYHVVRRSQRDVGTEATAETLSDFVLMPSPTNNNNNNNPNNNNAPREDRKLLASNTNAATDRDKTADSDRDQPMGQLTLKRKLDFKTLKSQIAAAGLLDETTKTYSQYTKPIERSGTYVPSNILHASDASNLDTLFTDTSKNTLDYALEEAMAVHEVGRMLDSIALTADCMEEDMAQALFDFEEGQFEEILDDFCITANKEELEDVDDVNGNDRVGTGGGGGGGEFNFEQHIQMLMEKARAQESGRDVGGRELDDNFFHGITPLHGRIDEEDDDDDDEFDYDQYDEHEEEEEDDYGDENGDSLDRHFIGKNDNDEQRTLCQKFEEALLEYDSDDVGNLDEECDDIVGDRPLEGDAQLEAALDEFLTEKEDEILIEGTRRNHVRSGGSGYSALVGKKMINADDLNKLDSTNNDSLLVNIEESKKQMARDLADADAILANPEMDLPPEEILIDGKSYFTATSRSMWDCESILSTYSNLDNNPVVIGRSKKKKSKKKNENNGNTYGIPEDRPAKIHLSNKTGLPLGTFGNNRNQSSEDNDYDEGDTFVSINRGEARNRDESKTDKKERKISVKEDRRICRMQKKIMKEAFKDEFQKRGHVAVVDSLGGNTVFRIS
jgi:protein LTV1